MLFSLVMAAYCIIVYPWFHRVPVVLLILCGAFVLPRGASICLHILVLLLTSFTALLLYMLLVLTVPRELQQEFVSPSGQKRLIIEYDHASRPSLYLRHGLFLKSVDTPEFKGTLQVITYHVKWLSEDDIMLYQVDGSSAIRVTLD